MHHLVTDSLALLQSAILHITNDKAYFLTHLKGIIWHLPRSERQATVLGPPAPLLKTEGLDQSLVIGKAF